MKKLAYKSEIRLTQGGFSKQEVSEAYTYVMHKHRGNPLINENWYLAEVIAETILQNRLSFWTILNTQKQKRAATLPT